jgi:phosphonopyruvate decarboxylase
MKPINPETFLKLLLKNKINFFCGVPDSILKNFTNCIDEGDKHIITANEGNAIATAAGYHLATKKMGLVYMQNSGLGNAINPLTSLVNEKTYSIPMILLIGWRGENGNDEPQHLMQGEILKNQLKLLKVKYIVLNYENQKSDLVDLLRFSLKNNCAVAIIIKKNTFKELKKIKKQNSLKISRSFAIDCILKNIDKKDLIFSSTGKISRQILQSKFYKKNYNNFFFNVGAMGHTASLAFGMSIETQKRVICIDGDGSFLMHLGSIPIIAKYKRKNFRYILLNNGAHESVGGQKTVALNINLEELSKNLGFSSQFSTKDPDYLTKNFKKIVDNNSNSFLEIKINLEDGDDLPRPENLKLLKENFNRN